MEKRRLGRSGLVVSDICLGTMTFGSTCDEAEAFRIMDRAMEAGIDFFDTAEMYPVPPDEKYVYATEEIVGRWLENQDRDRLVIATKFCGSFNSWFVPPCRTGKTAIDRHHIRRAVEGSLRRLRTDYVDLYQTHWPDHDFPYEQTLEPLAELIAEGKVRYIGSSNETAWGAMKAQAVADQFGLPRYETIQNNFSLINRRFEDALAEVCRREQISLLPYSPLGGGVLSGKYNQEPWPEGCRFDNYRRMGERQQMIMRRFVNERSVATAAAVGAIAAELSLPPVAVAAAWSKQHDFVGSTIVGANSVEQLNEILQADGLTLSDECRARIDEVSRQHPYPMG